MRKIREVLRLRCRMGLSIRQTSGSTGVRRSTVADYEKRFMQSGYTIDAILQLDDKAMGAALFSERRLPGSPKRPLPDMASIHLQMQNRKCTKVTLALLWEEYRQNHPDGYGYTQFCEYYRRYRQRLNPSMRQTHIGGEKLFIDYSGMTVAIHDAKTGEVTKAQIFVAVWGASGYTFVHATPSQRIEDFIHSHQLAFDFFGGVPRILVPDNLKSAVIKHTRYSVTLNESYAEMAAHYGIAVEPARPRRPKDKSKVEQGVQGIQRWLLARLRHRTFFTVDELNDALSALLKGYNNKVIRHLQKSRTELFEQLDKEAMNPLPSNRYVYTAFKLCRVHTDYHVTLKKCHYSVPHTLLNEEVVVRYNAQSVRIYHDNRLVAVHPRLCNAGEVSTLSRHMPDTHRYAKEAMDPQRLERWASRIGGHALGFVQNVLKQSEYTPNASRRIIAVLSMEKIYGASDLEAALAYALKKRTLQTKSVRSILDKKLYLAQSANNTKSASDVHNAHANLRGKDNYR